MKWIIQLLYISLCTGALASSADLLNEVYRAVEGAMPERDQSGFEHDAALAVLHAYDPGASLLADDQEAGEAQAGLDVWPGITLAMDEGKLVVESVVEKSPAALAGVQAGQVLKTIAGTSVSGLSLETALLRMDQALRKDALLELSLTSEEDKEVLELSFEALSGAPAVCSEEKWSVGVGYVRLRGLYGDAAQEVAALLKAWDLEELNGAILDLRAAQGGELSAVAEIAGLFSGPEAHLYTIQNADHQDVETVRSSWGGRINLPLMVLIDEHTKGASELLAAVLHGSARGVMLLGRPSAGDLGLRSAVPLTTGSTLIMSTRSLLTADGTRYAAFSQVTPDVEVSLDAPQLTRYVDPSEFDKLSDEELEDLELNNRLRGDPALRRSADILLGLKALKRRPPAVNNDTED